MLLDDRLRAAHDVAASLPVGDPLPIAQVERRARRRRTVVGVVFALAAVTGTTAVWTAVTAQTTTDRETPPADISAPSPASSVPVTADGGGIVTPLRLGDAGLRYVPGAWGTTATVSIGGGTVQVTTMEASATIADAGPAPDTDGFVEDWTAGLEEIPRLGPYGPRVTIDDTGSTTTVSGVIAGRRVTATSTSAEPDALMQLLRSVTTDVRVRPVRADPAIEVDLPDVVGLDYRDATEQLENVGVRVIWEVHSSDSDPAGLVASTDPPAGAKVASGSAVTVGVYGPEMHPRGGGPFALVAGPVTLTSPGFIDMRVRPPTGAAVSDEVVPVHAPIVFLHGELVGLWPSGGAFDGGQLLTDLVDPEFRYEPPSPTPTVPPLPLTQTATLGDVAVDVPAGWTIHDQACPATRAVNVGAPPAGCNPDVPGPWIALRAAPVDLTPCRTGGIETARSGGNLRTCWTDNLTNGTTDEFVLLGTGVLVVNEYGSVTMQDHADMRAAVDSLRSPSAVGATETAPYTQAIEAVAAIVDGRCDKLDQYLSPLDAEPPRCEPGNHGTAPVNVGTFQGHRAAPTLELDDMTYDAYDITTAEGETWHVEYRTYYDPAIQDAVTYLTRIDPPR